MRGRRLIGLGKTGKLRHHVWLALALSTSCYLPLNPRAWMIPIPDYYHFRMRVVNETNCRAHMRLVQLDRITETMWIEAKTDESFVVDRKHYLYSEVYVEYPSCGVGYLMADGFVEKRDTSVTLRLTDPYRPATLTREDHNHAAQEREHDSRVRP